MYDNEAGRSTSRHGGSAGSEPEAPPGPICREVSTINARLDRLAKASDALAELLSPILIVAPAGDAEKPPAAPIACPHHGELRGITDRLDGSISRLENLANRIAL